MEKLTNRLWDEWVLFPQRAEETQEEIDGILSGMDMLSSLSNGRDTVHLGSRRLWVFRRLRRLWSSSSWKGLQELGELLSVPREKHGRILLTLPASLYSEVQERSTEAFKKLFPRSLSWFRGIWGNLGSLYLPRFGYYLALKQPQEDQVRLRLQGILRGLNVRASSRRRGQRAEWLVRDQQTISRVLECLGLTKTVALLEQNARVRSLRERTNMIVNCDSANIRKSLEAAARHIALSKRLVEMNALEYLPDDLKELVVLRLQHPSLTLKELGQMLSRPVSKSTVEYRWNKLSRWAGMGTEEEK